VPGARSKARLGEPWFAFPTTEPGQVTNEPPKQSFGRRARSLPIRAKGSKQLVEGEAMQEKDVFSDAFFSQPSLLGRLWDSARDAMREFGANPRQYVASAIKGEAVGGRARIDRLRFGLALAVAVYMILIGFSLLFWSRTAAQPAGRFPDVTTWIRGPGRAPEPPKSAVADQDGGGGGGGRKDPRQATIGQLPDFSNSTPIIAPTTRIQDRTPSLPIPETLPIDMHLQPIRQDIQPTGLPAGVVGPPSDGPGMDGGIGDGGGGGIGPGEGPGSGRGKNGIDGGPGGPGGARGPVGAPQLSSRPIALNHPRPNYTEEARKQRVQGVVRARVLVDSDGSVKSVRILSGLPDGLDEEAIRAAYQMRFRAAISNGRPVETWVTLEIEFNLR